jgi:hypothetical protein
MDKNELYRYYNVGGEWAETEAGFFISKLMNEIDQMECQAEISTTNFIPFGKENEEKFADIYWLKTK